MDLKLVITNNNKVGLHSFSFHLMKNLIYNIYTLNELKF